MARVKFSFSGEKIAERQIKSLEQAVGATLPLQYRRFLRKHNGGTPNIGYFDCNQTGETLWVDDFLQAFSSKADETTVSVITDRYRQCIPADCLVIGFACRDDLLLLRVRGKKKGRVDLKCMATTRPPENAPRDREEAVYPLAHDLDRFLAALYKASEDFEPATFALDHARVHGQSLDRVLKSLGCRRKRTSPAAWKKQPTWLWDKYQGRWPDSPAWLEVEKNKTYGYAPKFDQRPAGHPMLRVTAGVPGRAECLRELVQVLGNHAVLLSRGG
jgi:hypothetical protein